MLLFSQGINTIYKINDIKVSYFGLQLVQQFVITLYKQILISTSPQKYISFCQGNNTAVFYISESSTTSLPNKPATPSTQQQKPRTKTTQIDDLRGQVKEVTNIMRTNVDEIAKRGEKLEDLETRSGHLEDLVTNAQLDILFRVDILL